MPAEVAPDIRVCHIVSSYPEPDKARVGGAFFRPFCAALEAQGVASSVLTGLLYPDSLRQTHDGGVEIRRFPFGEHTQDGPPSGGFLVRSGRYVRAGFRALSAWAHATPFAVFHGHQPLPCGLLAVLAGVRFRVPVVITTHGSDLLLYPAKRPLARWVLPWVFNRAACVIAVAPHLAAEVARFAPRARIEVIPMGYDDVCFTPGRPATERAPAIVSTRMLAWLYCVDTLVEAAKLWCADGWRVDIFGDGPDRGKLESLATEAPVTFHGAVDARTIAARLQEAAIYVSTSSTDGSSVSLLEAMACGAFPVVSDIPANRAWITHGENGLLFPVGDANRLASAVREALANPGLRAAAANANYEKVREARWPAIAQRVASIYEEIVRAS